MSVIVATPRVMAATGDECSVHKRDGRKRDIDANNPSGRNDGTDQRRDLNEWPDQRPRRQRCGQAEVGGHAVDGAD
jgi:hypothetical protein